MAHLEKYNRQDTALLLRHYSRSYKFESQYPENVDKNRTQYNYNLASSDQPLEQLEFFKKRLSEVKVMNRKDVKTMVDWVIPLGRAINSENKEWSERFFRNAYNFLADEYGRENVISSYVHLDEERPHMHFSFIPIVEDKKKGGLKVCAKEILTKNYLEKFHERLSKACGMSEDGMSWNDTGVLTGITKKQGGAKTVKELKAERELAQISKSIIFATSDYTEKIRVIQNTSVEQIEKTVDLPSEAKEVTHGFGKNKEEYIQMPKIEFMRLLALSQVAPHESVNLISNIINELKASLNQFDKLAKSYEKLKQTYDKEHTQLYNAKKEIKDIKLKLEQNEKMVTAAVQAAYTFPEEITLDIIGAMDKCYQELFNSEFTKNAPENYNDMDIIF